MHFSIHKISYNPLNCYNCATCYTLLQINGNILDASHYCAPLHSENINKMGKYEFSLSQKIFLVKSFYKNGEKMQLTLQQLRQKFNVQISSAPNILVGNPSLHLPECPQSQHLQGYWTLTNSSYSLFLHLSLLSGRSRLNPGI